MRPIDCRVQILGCGNCFSEFSSLLFYGDTDFDTAGLYSAGSCVEHVVVAIESDGVEDAIPGAGFLDALRARVKMLTGIDAAVSSLIRVEENAKVIPGQSFADFNKTYREPTLVFRCICCLVGEARVHTSIDVPEYVAKGGRVLLTGRLVLND